MLTHVRLLFLVHCLVGQAKEGSPLRRISSVDSKSGDEGPQRDEFAAKRPEVLVSMSCSQAVSGTARRSGILARRVRIPAGTTSALSRHLFRLQF